MVSASVIESYDFEPFQNIVDIGGGKGIFCKHLLDAYPRLKTTIFELEKVKRQAEEFLQPYKSRSQFVSGDFFQKIPSDKDVYILKSILHDWPDEKAGLILRQCHEAMREDSCLSIIAPAITKEKLDYAKAMDILMMIVTGGRERTAEEYIHLIEEKVLCCKNI
ncbi:MAG: hypothetical protein Tsb0015_09510 [Simkaniaceae bacterium]